MLHPNLPLKGFLTLVFFLSFNSLTFSQNWLLNFDQAKQEAQSKNQPIVLVFQGSDWCAPCIKLDREVWSTEAFTKYAASHFVMLQADFPRRKKNALTDEQQERNNALAEKYNKQGIFPFVVILDASGHVLGETGYKKMTPEAYITHLNSFLK